MVETIHTPEVENEIRSALESRIYTVIDKLEETDEVACKEKATSESTGFETQSSAYSSSQSSFSDTSSETTFDDFLAS